MFGTKRKARELTEHPGVQSKSAYPATITGCKPIFGELAWEITVEGTRGPVPVVTVTGTEPAAGTALADLIRMVQPHLPAPDEKWDPASLVGKSGRCKVFFWTLLMGVYDVRFEKAVPCPIPPSPEQIQAAQERQAAEERARRYRQWEDARAQVQSRLRGGELLTPEETELLLQPFPG